MANQGIQYKESLYMLTWLKAALKKEKDKYEKCPILPDMVPDYEIAQAWGYVVIGYALVEEALKALLHIREKEVPAEHSLSKLFDLLDEEDKEVLREYYADYRVTIGGNLGLFPFESIDEFLVNLDGGKNKRGDHVGSFDWRYFPIEEVRSRRMPSVCVDYMHEIVFGCVQILRYLRISRFNPARYTHSWRMRQERRTKRRNWLNAKLISDEWDKLGDRLEILWGPDYKGRHDLCLFQGKEIRSCFSAMPDDLSLRVIDRRQEIEAFNSQA